MDFKPDVCVYSKPKPKPFDPLKPTKNSTFETNRKVQGECVPIFRK